MNLECINSNYSRESWCSNPEGQAVVFLPKATEFLMWNSSDAVRQIMEAEDRKIHEELSIFVHKGHKMVAVISQEGRKRRVKVCSLCGFRIRIKANNRFRREISDCPVAVVEKIMNS
jgi:hypothetical protein